MILRKKGNVVIVGKPLRGQPIGDKNLHRLTNPPRFPAKERYHVPESDLRGEERPEIRDFPDILRIFEKFSGGRNILRIMAVRLRELEDECRKLEEELKKLKRERDELREVFLRLGIRPEDLIDDSETPLAVAGSLRASKSRQSSRGATDERLGRGVL